MNQDALNMSIRKFLKKVGVTSQREIEKAVAERNAGRSIEGRRNAFRQDTADDRCDQSGCHNKGRHFAGGLGAVIGSASGHKTALFWEHCFQSNRADLFRVVLRRARDERHKEVDRYYPAFFATINTAFAFTPVAIDGRSQNRHRYLADALSSPPI